jgi:hypothetical protein
MARGGVRNRPAAARLGTGRALVLDGRTAPRTGVLAGAVQTFLPYADFRASAEVLDDKRLGKQRVETLQVMRALVVPGYGWQSHPVTAMWRGYRPALMAYQVETCAAWVARGFADTCLDKTLATLDEVPADAAAFRADEFELPPWFGREDVHRSHRSKLLAKAPEAYAAAFGDEPVDLDYIWPVPTSGDASR